MPRESLANKKARASQIYEILQDRYTTSEALLQGETPFQFMIAVMLSAQSTDARVNAITPQLWERYPTVESLANANIKDVEEIIRSVGFYHVKAKNAIGCAQMLLDDFNGVLPHSMEELQKFPGVGRKSANVVTNTCFDIVEGIAVDTHVFRIAHKLKLSNAKTAQQTETDLLKIFPQSQWKAINHHLVRFGREVCSARKPQCETCPLQQLCPSADLP